ncbi:MAG: hypothetical protein IJM92_10335 [Fibrobacter sp.]|uniref:hypothetical protein n=1 Tax=Fibrobacter sp. TaxID=35828 RepID=UPI0025BD8286|nr:hypothetical protein [Fibrobacter sp.]MBQ7080033.1 hypothetical protein [Fibrobacter sp.]
MMIPDWKLERFLTGDLPEKEMNEIRKLEAADAMLAQRVKMLREDNKAILNKLPFEMLAEKIDAVDAGTVTETAVAANLGTAKENAGNAEKNAPRFSIMKFAAAAVFVLAVALVAFMAQRETSVMNERVGSDVAAVGGPRNTQVALAETQSDTRIKGMDARMEVWKKTPAGIVQLNDLDSVGEGDEIQLRYSVPEKCFGLLFSMDGNGALTLHMGNGEKAVELAPGKMNSLPFAYKLDDAPYFEKFFFVTSPKEFTVEECDVDKLLKRSDVKVIGFTLKKAGK